MSKKFIFSAVALMAFSFAGMANEIEETKVEAQTLESHLIEKAILLKEKDCFEAVMIAMDNIESLIGPLGESTDTVFSALLTQCEINNYNLSPRP